MSIQVRGYLDGVVYEVQLTGNKENPAVGSPRVAALLQQQSGRPVNVSPVGPTLNLDLGDPASVLAALEVFTRVTKVTGADDLTAPLGAKRLGAVD